ncbi:hypothetical protein DNK49_19105 [Azoarcus communis]|uniref:Uncharacterized protein n=1 Tax=Parazoarcus communis SWub3 = DSM 12120 TaxID=1121029 RepID=A0A323UTJ3_9RHOO|nr:hypothetical protein [Parazoarcus communis SWub3 = DSM 12120]PZA14990.1 hypothetical protein DNK49_19105 [Azoarcus communis] [Parazoarcus communis SWub3 = DSM 12120]
MQLALYKGRGSLGNALIRWWTKSEYSHCEVVALSQYGYSSSIRDGGVRMKRIDWNPEHWDFIELPWADIGCVTELYVKTAGEPYGYWDLLTRQIFNRPGDAPGWFCSEWCAAALGFASPQIYSPALLAQACRMRNAE